MHDMHDWQPQRDADSGNEKAEPQLQALDKPVAKVITGYSDNCNTLNHGGSLRMNGKHCVYCC